MLKKTITYTTFDGEEVTEDFYFNYTKAEIAEMQFSQKGGFDSYIQGMIDAQDGPKIVAEFKKILTSAIGRRSEDGKRFIKSQEIVDEFLQSEAYSELFMELITDSNVLIEFVNGLMPADLVEKVRASELQGGDGGDEEDTRPEYVRQNREPTQKELQNMTTEELRQAFAYRQQLKKTQ